jgi:cytochrome c oxidase subunit 1
MLITIPSGIQIFCWIATLWGTRPRFATPLLFALGFVMLFVMGGVTGVMVASVPIDTQVHDTFFVVAHFHYTLIGGAVFPLFGAIYYWFPKVTGRLMSERLGKLNFWLLFVGFNLTFFPMHVLGLEGMPRRVYTYVPETGWGDLNLLATAGAVVLAVSVLVFAANVLLSLRRGEVAGPDPWGGETLEWATGSPPPPYNFLRPPTVRHRAPLWVGWDESPVVTGLATDHHEVLCTTVLDAAPEHRYALPGHSIWPLLLAVVAGGAILGVIFHPWAFPIGFVLGTIVLICWFWEGTKSPGVPEDAETEAGPLGGPSKTAPLPEHVHHETAHEA